ncbi:MAG: helix-turn-helix domain-containing protein [Geodermatophilaceae bacterium]|nr:helix-turn-helix domain-containing protein [Geodermatophilaceae bacterium]
MIRWRSRFAEHGLAGLVDQPRSGKPPTINESVRDEILTATLIEPPSELGITHWSSRRLATWLRRQGNRVSPVSISRL